MQADRHKCAQLRVLNVVKNWIIGKSCRVSDVGYLFIGEVLILSGCECPRNSGLLVSKQRVYDEDLLLELEILFF